LFCSRAGTSSRKGGLRHFFQTTLVQNVLLKYGGSWSKSGTTLNVRNLKIMGAYLISFSQNMTPNKAISQKACVLGRK
jgi:hypothetical protein